MEPERPIEKLLRAFARKRREQAGDPPGFELHNATRRLLQGEVARRSPRPREGNFFLRLFSLARPRLAFALSVVAITVLGIALLLPSLSASKARSKLAASKVGTFRESKQVAETSATPSSAARAPQTPPPATLIAESDSAASQKKLDEPVFEEMKNRPASEIVRVRRSATNGTLEIASQGRSRSELQSGTVAVGGMGGFGGGSVSTNAADAFRTDLAYKTETGSRDVSQANAAAPARAGGFFNGGSNLSLAAAEPVDRKLQFDDLGAEAAKAPTTGPAGQGGGGGGGGGDVATQTAATRFFALNDETRPGSPLNLNRQKFVQLNTGWKDELERSNAVPVLTNFAVEQNGGQMRVVDSDGSVYEGYLQIVGTPAMALSGKTALAGEALAKDVAEKDKTPESVENYYFRVAGTNRSLKQNVVFTGNFLNLTNSANLLPPAGAITLGIDGQYDATAPVRLQQLPLQNSLINGTFQLNNTRAIPIQATPAPAAPQK